MQGDPFGGLLGSMLASARDLQEQRRMWEQLNQSPLDALEIYRRQREAQTPQIRIDLAQMQALQNYGFVTTPLPPPRHNGKKLVEVRFLGIRLFQKGS